MSYQLEMRRLDERGSLPREFWVRRDLSFKAKAVFAYLLTEPAGFLPRVAEVEAQLRIGRDARKGAYRELREAGLIVTRNGQWSVNMSAELNT